jgi:isochorismate pyruvate lyase
MLRILLLAAALIVSFRLAKAQNDAANHPAFRGSPSVDGGKCCETLAEVRENIDRIDRQILTLMAERGKYVAEAGRFKLSPAAVSDPARVEAIIAKVRTIAGEDGLSPEVAERTYRAMIAAFEEYEREDWIKRNAGGAVVPAK